MGCDIHAYVEYRKADGGSNPWYNFGGRINPGRNYMIFGLMARVRNDFPESYDPQGLPSDLSYASRSDSTLYISDDSPNVEGHCSMSQAIKWGGKLYERDGIPYLTDHPDWHSHSWLTIAEFEDVLQTYDRKSLIKSTEPEYRALLAAMKELEKYGNEVRLVFWFDN